MTQCSVWFIVMLNRLSHWSMSTLASARQDYLQLLHKPQHCWYWQQQLAKAKVEVTHTLLEQVALCRCSCSFLPSFQFHGSTLMATLHPLTPHRPLTQSSPPTQATTSLPPPPPLLPHLLLRRRLLLLLFFLILR